MKLLVCVKCNDVFSLSLKRKTCSCGETWGQYLQNGLHALYGGNCFPLGFANWSFVRALKNQPEVGPGKSFEAFVIEKDCPTMRKVGGEEKEKLKKAKPRS